MRGPIRQALGRPRGERGFTLLEVMVGMLLLAAIVIVLSQAYLAALSRAGETGDQSAGAAWMQAMVDYLRNTGYALSGSWDEIPASCPQPRPCLPKQFASARVAVTSGPGAGLKQVNITLYRQGVGAPFLALSTYLADTRFP